jgi:ATP-dependent helicase/nuclease subunit B
VEIIECLNPETELVAAAREIVRFVRAGARWREVAVIVRSLDPYRERLPEVFRRYEIPFFLDARESVGHHPLAELTRSALRVLAFGWRHADWFAALKTGLLPANEEQVDRLENEALARGWEGAHWRRTWTAPETRALEPLRHRLVTPFQTLERAWRDEPGPTGRELAHGLHAFWRRLRVDRTLDQWAETAADKDAGVGGLRPQVHRTVLEQMIAWLRNVALAFPDTRLPLREWLPILETGLGSLTVGVVPPALDQVLVGAIDRSRNPELRLAILLGLNEDRFPATPAPGRLLTENDRAALAEDGVTLGPDRRWRLGRERYYGYIACTRPRERLLLTCARQNAEGGVLNRSIFLDHLARLFPALETRLAESPSDWRTAVQVTELFVPALRCGLARETAVPRLLEASELGGLRPLFVGATAEEPATLWPKIADRLYGSDVLHLSASGLQDFAACPFKFFVSRGLRAAERRVFEVDTRRQGSFCHEVLARYHHAVRAQGRQWRDLSPEEAEKLVERLAAEVTREFEAGVFDAAARNRFQAATLTAHLREFIRCFTEWLRTSYRLDPVAVEWGFGGRDAAHPAWELPLPDGRRLALVGKIDRVDMARDPEQNRQLLVVMDYKSSPRSVDPALLDAGVELQLPLYLLTLLRLGGVDDAPGREPVEPLGMFFVGLRPKRKSEAHGEAARKKSAQGVRGRWQHRGRFVAPERSVWLDTSSDRRRGSGQFSIRSGSSDPLSREAFQALLEHTEQQVRELGERIFAGEIRVDPYVKGNQCACEHCDYAGICRIDPWRHTYRRLSTPKHPKKNAP